MLNSKLATSICATSFCIALSTSCVNLARRYRNWTSNTIKIHEWVSKEQVLDYADIILTDKKIPELVEPSTPTIPYIIALTAEGQAEYLKAIAAKTSDADAFIKKAMQKQPPQKGLLVRVKIYPKTITKVLNFSVHKRMSGGKPGDNTRLLFLEANRISALELYLDMADPTKHLEFFDWDKYTSAYGSVDLGKVSSAQSWNATAEVGANVASSLADKSGTTSASLLNQTFNGTANSKKSSTVVANGVADGGTNINPSALESSKGTATTSQDQSTSGTSGEKTRTSGFNIGPKLSGTVGGDYKTEQNLLFKRLELSGNLQPFKMFLRQEGSQGIDLSSNTAVTIKYRTDVPWAAPVKVIKFEKLYDDADVPLPAISLKRSYLFLMFPDFQGDINGTLRYKYIYRQVIGGSRHLPEARQKVTFWYGEVGFGGENNTTKKPNKSTAPPTVPPAEKPLENEQSSSKSPTASSTKNKTDPERLQKVLYGENYLLVRDRDFRPTTYKLAVVNHGVSPQTVSSQVVIYNNEMMQFETLADATDFMLYLHTLLVQGANVSRFTVGDPNTAGRRIVRLSDFANLTPASQQIINAVEIQN
jgi:hypothetical protein